MSTLADELLNDFEDSGSEGETDQRDGNIQESETPTTSLNGRGKITSMILDGDEEDDGDDDETMQNGTVSIQEADDEEEAKAKVEKMQLGAVSDVRTVAGLMKTLEPVLEVSFISCFAFLFLRDIVYIFFDLALTLSIASRKLHIIKTSLKRLKVLLLVLSRTILNTISLRKQTLFRLPSTMKLFSSTNSFEITTPPAFLNSRLS